MIDVNYLAVGVAAVAGFVVSPVWYAVFGNQLRELSPAAASMGKPPAWKLLVEVGRCLVLAAVLGGLAALLEPADWTGGVRLGLALWIGFPVVLWIGAIIWEAVPWRLAAIHAGDWLLKLLVIAVIVSAWR